jgi:putative acetyltransferase
MERMQNQHLEIRPIEERDNPILASIIRHTLEEFGANHPGTVYYDAETDHLFEVFQTPQSWYFVAIHKQEVVGGAGIYPTRGLPEHTCELVKMYLLPSARGMGLGQYLLEQCFEKARQFGFKQMYLETMPELTHAVPMYEKNGFAYLKGPLGESGHFGCAIQMLKPL